MNLHTPTSKVNIHTRSGWSTRSASSEKDLGYEGQPIELQFCWATISLHRWVTILLSYNFSSTNLLSLLTKSCCSFLCFNWFFLILLINHFILNHQNLFVFVSPTVLNLRMSNFSKFKSFEWSGTFWKFSENFMKFDEFQTSNSQFSF